MDARVKRLAPVLVLVVAAIGSMGANYSYRTTNFLCTAPDPTLAQQICVQGEAYRKELALKWLGSELPDWSRPCPIVITQVGPHVGAGGATRISFDPAGPFFDMSIQGSTERLLDSVLPHEITHTIFASHFRRPLPRWADEGACTTVEHASERNRNHQMLLEFLTSRPSRGIAFNRMFAMKEYPRDIMPLYSQGYSVTKFLIFQGGEQKFVRYIGDGMKTNDWTTATKSHYGYDSLSDLQVEWLAWVREGSTPELAVAAQQRQYATTGGGGEIATVSATSTARSDNAYLQNAQGQAKPQPFSVATTDNYPTSKAGDTPADSLTNTAPQQLVPLPPIQDVASAPADQADAAGWYKRQSEEVQAREALAAQQLTPYAPGSIGRATHSVPIESTQNGTMLGRPQPPQQTIPRALPPRHYQAGGQMLR